MAESGRLGRLGLILGMLGGVTFQPCWLVIVVRLDCSLLLMFGGLLLFGLTALQSAPAQGNHLP
jgi:hypothetical protein